MVSNCIKCILCFIVDVVLAVSVWTISMIIRKQAIPYHRGFFCDDESLMYPFHDSTISAALMYSVGIILPCAFIILMECWIECTIHKSHTQEHRPQIDVLFIRLFKILVAFFFGGGVTNLLTNIAKYTIGRLRPHFFAVCKPDWNSVVCSTGSIPQYVQADVCTGTDKDLISEARLSFLSGHASMSMYFMVFLMIYTQRRFACKCVQLLRPALQTLFFTLAMYTGMTRISDYKHHWSDVLAGQVLGAAVAIVIVYKASRLYTVSHVSTTESHSTHDKSESHRIKDGGIQQVVPAHDEFDEATDL